MSYEIYKTVKQLKNGAFEVVSAANNVRPLYFSKWIMDWFNKNWPEATNAEKRACWMLYSAGAGDHFYQKAWKEDSEAGARFMRDHGYDWQVIHTNPSQWLEYAREFLKWKEANQPQKFKVLLNGAFVARLTTRGAKCTFDSTRAKIFNAFNASDLLEKFKYFNCKIEVITCAVNQL